MDAIDLREIHRQLEELRIRCDYIEGYQRNAESGTTACSAAGGGIEKMKTARSAGREPRLIEAIRSRLKERVEHHRTISTKATEQLHLLVISELIILAGYLDGLEAGR